MNSIAELVDQLKTGNISKEELLEKIYSSSFQRSGFAETENEVPEMEVDTFSFEGYGQRIEPSFSMIKTEIFLERQTQWEVRKNLNQEILKEQKLRNESKECTFKPNTNCSPSKFSPETIHRLAKHKDLSKFTQIKQQIEYEKLQNELSACTFEPKINPRSLKTAPRYLSQSPSRSSQPSGPTFAPRVKGPSKQMQSAREYLKQDPFHRLSAIKNSPEPEAESPKCKTPALETYGSTFSTRPFFERQALYELMKHEKKEALEYSSDFKPMINERSRKLVKKKFSERNQEMIEKKRKPKEDPNFYSFHPQITEMAKLRKYRSVAELSSTKKIEKSEADTVEMKEEMVKESRNYKSVKSKLQILQDPEGFIERLKLEQRKREMENAYVKEEMMRKELEECSHQPVVIEAPGYIKQIARNMAMLKSEMISKRLSPKPDWR